jgi:hypothetical protein
MTPRLFGPGCVGLLLACALPSSAEADALPPCGAPASTVEVQLERQDRFLLTDGRELLGQMVEGTAGGYLLLTPDGELRFVRLAQVARFELDFGPAPPLGTAFDCAPCAQGEPLQVEGSNESPTVAAVSRPPPTSPSPEQRREARRRRWERERKRDPLELGFELLPFWGMGGRGEYKIQQPWLESVGLRAGFTSSALEGFPVPFPLWLAEDAEDTRRALYLAGVADLLPTRTQISLSAGWSYHFTYDGYTGMALGVALRHELPEVVSLHAGVLVLTDMCWREPLWVLDVGPHFAW